MTEEALRQALAEARSAGYLILPEGVTVGPSPGAGLARAIEAMTIEDMVAGGGVVWPDNHEIRLLKHARDRIAAAVRSRPLVPLVDEWGNVFGWRFGED
jgi:hypothetical protein